jgi:hypothetical protein
MSHGLESSGSLDIRSLKRWAAESLPRSSQLRGLLVLEDDVLSVDDYLARISVWLRLLGLELAGRDL